MQIAEEEDIEKASSRPPSAASLRAASIPKRRGRQPKATPTPQPASQVSTPRPRSPSSSEELQVREAGIGQKLRVVFCTRFAYPLTTFFCFQIAEEVDTDQATSRPPSAASSRAASTSKRRGRLQKSTTPRPVVVQEPEASPRAKATVAIPKRRVLPARNSAPRATKADAALQKSAPAKEVTERKTSVDSRERSASPDRELKVCFVVC